MIRLIDAGGIEIAADLAEHVFVAGFLEIGEHDFLCVSVSLVAGLAELFGSPQAKQLVAARLCLEAELLVVGELVLVGVLAVFIDMAISMETRLALSAVPIG